MIKRNLAFILCLFIISSLFSQKKEFCGKIEYKFTTNFSYKYVENYELTFNNKESFCEEIGIKKVGNNKSDEQKEEGLQQNFISGRKNTTSKYFYNNRRDFYFRDNYLDEVLLVKEKPLNAVWKLHAETKKMSNFLCKKATIYFRGRNYTAWYAPKIPVPFGPWKLRGLPGVILELYDAEKVFHVVAKRVQLGSSNCSINIDKKGLEKAISISSYLLRKEELIDIMFAELSAKRPKGTKPMVRDKDCNDCKEEIEKFNEGK